MLCYLFNASYLYWKCKPISQIKRNVTILRVHLLCISMIERWLNLNHDQFKIITAISPITQRFKHSLLSNRDHSVYCPSKIARHTNLFRVNYLNLKTDARCRATKSNWTQSPWMWQDQIQIQRTRSATNVVRSIARENQEAPEPAGIS